VQLRLTSLGETISASWFNPRTGERHSASGMTEGETLHFHRPGTGDWVLFIYRQAAQAADRG
jgi:hypothetical protein